MYINVVSVCVCVCGGVVLFMEKPGRTCLPFLMTYSKTVLGLSYLVPLL